ncbi:MAG: phosphatase PAP2 family protein [Desulfovibrio sp.]|jgi:acid phosphatase (class A)|nr:phosphatase PAP2 family protein [Desulfovibrio sp.]
MKKVLLFLCWLCFTVIPVNAGAFVSANNVPDSLAFLPPPPAPESPAFARDQAVYLQTRGLKGTDRWRQAAFDADIRNNWPDFFKDALGFSLDKKRTPALYALLAGIAADFGEAARTAKKKYQRVRPFMYFGQDGATCAPAQEEHLKTNGSYPSGHTTLGWGMALILAEVVPARKDAILKRGYEYGMSRVVCGVHWQSDVDAGFLVGSAVVAYLHNVHEFQKLLQSAKAEVASLQDMPKGQ